MSQNDVNEFIRVGLAAICALAYCGWQLSVLKVAMAPIPARRRTDGTHDTDAEP